MSPVSPPPRNALENYADERWNRVLQVNLNSAFYCIGEAARHMKLRSAGRIVVPTSTTSVHVSPGIGAAYMAAKAGVSHLKRNTALELAHYNILVNAIRTRSICDQDWQWLHSNSSRTGGIPRRAPLKRMASISEIQGLTLLLASCASSFITDE